MFSVVNCISLLYAEAACISLWVLSVRDWELLHIPAEGHPLSLAVNLISHVVCQVVTLKSLWDTHPCVVFFLRRFGCQVCRWIAKEASKLKATLDSNGVRLIGVAPESVGLKEFLDENYFKGGRTAGARGQSCLQDRSMCQIYLRGEPKTINLVIGEGFLVWVLSAFQHQVESVVSFSLCTRIEGEGVDQEDACHL